MGARYISRIDETGHFAIIDTATGRNARYADYELTGIPARMLDAGLRIMNGIEEAERTLLRLSPASPTTH